jgi:hypothetical protein
MNFVSGYTFTKVRTSHGPDMYISRYGKLVKVVPFSTHVELNETYVNDLIRQIESME